MIERVAKALLASESNNEKSWESLDLITRGAFLRDARAAIEAMRVPVIGQVSAAARKADVVGAGDFVAIWNAMVDAALADGEG